jgi:hypothetical protein
VNGFFGATGWTTLHDALVFLVLVAALYPLLRWALAPALLQFASGVELSLNLLALTLLLPEYLCTRAARRATGRAAPLAHVYGDAVCGAVCGIHRSAAWVLSGLHIGASRLEHREALGLGIALALFVIV